MTVKIYVRTSLVFISVLFSVYANAIGGRSAKSGILNFRIWYDFSFVNLGEYKLNKCDKYQEQQYQSRTTRMIGSPPKNRKEKGNEIVTWSLGNTRNRNKDKLFLLVKFVIIIFL